jgi:maltooligosyltrehalose trehalohydrolase
VAFGWSPDEVPDPQAEETFLRSRLRWEELDQPQHAEMLDWYCRLIALRRQECALTRTELGNVGVRFDESQKWLWMTRGPVEVVFNAGTSQVTMPIRHSYETMLASSREIVCGADHLRLPAGSVAVLRNRDVPKGL